MSENRCCGGLSFRNMVLRGDGSSIIYGAFYKRGARITDFSDKSITCVVLTLEEQEVCALDDITTAEDGSVCILIAPNTLGEGRYYYHISLKDFNGGLIAEYKNEMDIVSYSEPCEESFNKEGISSFFAVERVLKGKNGVDGKDGVQEEDIFYIKDMGIVKAEALYNDKSQGGLVYALPTSRLVEDGDYDDILTSSSQIFYGYAQDQIHKVEGFHDENSLGLIYALPNTRLADSGDYDEIIATESYVDRAISSAITNTLNTAV
jgi:hypothetical protein